MVNSMDSMENHQIDMNTPGPLLENLPNTFSHSSRFFSRLPKLCCPNSIRNIPRRVSNFRPRSFRAPKLFARKTRTHHAHITDEEIGVEYHVIEDEECHIAEGAKRHIAEDEECHIVEDENQFFIERADLSQQYMENSERDLSSLFELSPLIKPRVILTYNYYFKEDSPVSNYSFKKTILNSAKMTNTKMTSNKSGSSTFSNDVLNSTTVNADIIMRDSLRMDHFMRVATIHGRRVSV